MSEIEARVSRWHDARFGSFLDFYRTTYGQCITETRVGGRTGTTLLNLAQSAGDWSDAPVPDLVLNINRGAELRGRFDLGAGAFAPVIAPGDFFVVPPNTPTVALCDSANRVDVVALPWRALRGFVGDDWLPADGDFRHLHVGAHRDRRVARAIQGMWRAARDDSAHRDLSVDSAVLELVAALLSLRNGQTRELGVVLAPWQERRVTEALAMVSGDLSLADLAAMCGLSTFHFARAFKASTGLPPHAWRRRLRIERAKALLETTSLPVTEVALAVGYESSQALARLFAREIGCSPSRWRRERRD